MKKEIKRNKNAKTADVADWFMLKISASFWPMAPPAIMQRMGKI